jgi:hypothetical protein
VSADPATIASSEVRVGDRIRSREMELTVTRIDTGFLGRDEMLAFVEDSEQQWLKIPSPVTGTVELVSR